MSLSSIIARPRQALTEWPINQNLKLWCFKLLIVDYYLQRKRKACAHLYLRCSTWQPTNPSGHCPSQSKEETLIECVLQAQEGFLQKFRSKSIDYVVFAQQKPVGKSEKPPALPPKSDQKAVILSAGAVCGVQVTIQAFGFRSQHRPVSTITHSLLPQSVLFTFLSILLGLPFN